jgi:hypothetical protein
MQEYPDIISFAYTYTRELRSKTSSPGTEPAIIGGLGGAVVRASAFHL